MSRARLVITAVMLEKRPTAEVAITYNVARSWIYELLARYRDEGEAAFTPRSRHPRTSPGATDPETVCAILPESTTSRCPARVAGCDYRWPIGATQRKALRIGRRHQHEDEQWQRCIPAASAARVPSAAPR